MKVFLLSITLILGNIFPLVKADYKFYRSFLRFQKKIDGYRFYRSFLRFGKNLTPMKALFLIHAVPLLGIGGSLCLKTPDPKKP